MDEPPILNLFATPYAWSIPPAELMVLVGCLYSRGFVDMTAERPE
jgi:hypothetical protein